MQQNTSAQIARKTRWHRKWHRNIAMIGAAFLLFTSITGLLLAWKKNSGGYLLAESKKGSSPLLSQWLSFETLSSKAITALREKHGGSIDTVISRIDARPDKGMVKFIFENHYHALQVDAVTGNILLYEERRADFIEQLHDGSIIDKLLSANGLGKLTYSTIGGISLLLLTITGFWLWYNPKRIRKRKAEIQP